MKDKSLVTTVPRHKGDLITSDVGEFAQPSIHPNARGKKKLKATDDIAKNNEVTVPAARRAEIIKDPVPPKKRILIKPAYVEPEPYVEPKVKVKRKVSKPTQSKFERDTLKRLKVLQEMFSDKTLADRLKIPVSNHIIAIPERGPDQDKTEKALHKLLVKERKRWVNYINQNPRNKMTDTRAWELIEKIVKR